MSSQNVLRRLEHALVNENEPLPAFSEDITEDTKLVKPGYYYCNAAEGPITIAIDIAVNGVEINIKRTDSSSNSVTVNALIDNEQSVTLYARECLRIRFHNSGWHII